MKERKKERKKEKTENEAASVPCTPQGPNRPSNHRSCDLKLYDMDECPAHSSRHDTNPAAVFLRSITLSVMNLATYRHANTTQSTYYDEGSLFGKYPLIH